MQVAPPPLTTAASVTPLAVASPAPAASPSASPVVPTPGRSLAPLTCRTGSPIPLPGRAFDDAGLPLPGALPLGAKIADLPALQGARRRTLLGDGASVMTGKVEAFEVAGYHVEIAGGAWGESTGYLAGAAITAPGGLDTAVARAWLQAMVPCEQVPDLATERSYDEEGSVRVMAGSARQLEPGAGFYSSPGAVGDAFDLWAVKAPVKWVQLHGAFANAASPEPAPAAAPAGRWLGVVGWAIVYGK
jgi:hypothetical protein